MASIAPRPAQQQGALSLPPGATIIQQSPAGGQQNNMGSFALVPAQYVQQVSKESRESSLELPQTGIGCRGSTVIDNTAYVTIDSKFPGE
jgi:hypothetical protein